MNRKIRMIILLGASLLVSVSVAQPSVNAGSSLLHISLLTRQAIFKTEAITYPVNKAVVVRNKPVNSRGVFIRNLRDRITFGMSILSKSGVTKEHLDSLLKGTPLANLSDYYIEAENKYGVNALTLVSISIHESGWGRSRLARTRNNLFGFQAYDGAVHKAKRFSSKGECILFVAGFLHDHYLSSTGKYYRGNTLSSVGISYASDKRWARSIFGVMRYSLKIIEKAHYTDKSGTISV